MNDGCRFSGKCSLARGHFVENQAEREYVRARVQPFTAHLFRRHVTGCAHGNAGSDEGKTWTLLGLIHVGRR
jgi:hypothetical protein